MFHNNHKKGGFIMSGLESTKKTQTGERKVNVASDRMIKGDMKTQSGIEVKEVYGPEDTKHLDFEKDIGQPGSFPYLRGSYKRMYRDRLWTSGNPILASSTPYMEEKGISGEEYIKDLMDTGIVCSAIRSGGDYHNLATVDPDHPLVKYDIGNCVGTFYAVWQMIHGRKKQYPLILEKSVKEGMVFEFGHQVGPADVCEYAMCLSMLEIMGLDPREFRGNMVNDPLTSHINKCMYYKQPLEVGFRVSMDGQEYAYNHTPKFRPSNGGCAYDLREAGIDTIQELGFRFGNFVEYSDELVRRGMSFENFGNRPAMAFSGEIDFFETVCKLRAARRMWARIARDRYGADTSMMKCPPCGTNCAGDSMTQRQPIFNVVRQTVEAMASFMGGVNGIEMKAYTEGVSPPTTEGLAVNRGIEKILAEEANIALVADPLGGSYYVEWLTDYIESKAMELLQKILDMGGMIACIKDGWIQKETERAAQERARELEEGRKIRVGENAYQELNDYHIPLPMFDFERGKPGKGYTKKQERDWEEWHTFQKSRDLKEVAPLLKKLHQLAKSEENLIAGMIDAFKGNATIGEVMGVIREGMGFPYDQFEMVSRPEWLTYD
jgi:methylmalonyl-CoA mutase N-terminal domain/subunit